MHVINNVASLGSLCENTGCLYYYGINIPASKECQANISTLASFTAVDWDSKPWPCLLRRFETRTTGG